MTQDLFTEDFKTDPYWWDAAPRPDPGEVELPEEVDVARCGSVERTLRTDSLRWVVDSMLQYGENAEVAGPAAARAEMSSVLDDWLDFYKQHPK